MGKILRKNYIGSIRITISVTLRVFSLINLKGKPSNEFEKHKMILIASL